MGKRSRSTQGNTTEPQTTAKSSPQCLTFKGYAAKKATERSTFFRSSSSKREAKAKDVNPFTIINIGIMRYVNPDLVMPVRGKCLPLKVKKKTEYTEVLTDALMNRQAHDQTFDMERGWKLVYPDGQITVTLPGQPDEDFSLEKYKNDLGKQYSRITGSGLCPDKAESDHEETEESADLQDSW